MKREDQDAIARIEGRLITPPDFIHNDDCPMSDDFHSGSDDEPECICQELKEHVDFNDERDI